MTTKKGFNRFVSVLLSFAIVISTFAGLSLNTLMSAASTEPEMHIIVKHWHAGDDEPKVSDITLHKDGTYNDNGEEVQPEGGAADEQTLTFNANPDASKETFSGFAVSAGNDCVTLNSSAATPNFTVKYDPNVHLVKVHVFYSAKPKLVPGTEMQVGAGTGVEIDDEYQDTKTQTWGDLDPTLKENIIKALGDDGVIDPDSLSDTDLIKLYNTSEGLHTDKTATAVYDGDENDAGTTEDDIKDNGTRVFDINLEAWYNYQAKAKVGLILDASGSMAFISDGLTPMHFDYDEGKGYKIGSNTNLDVKPNQYLTPAQVNQLLDINLTDNSKLSYSGYTYYIFDTRDFTQEFVPLAYWGGEEKSKIKPIALYPFDGTLNEKIKSGVAKLINNVAKGGTFNKDSIPTVSVAPTYVTGDNNTLDLKATAEKGGLMLDIDTPEKFTIAMRIQSTVYAQDKNKYEEIPLVYIGDPNGQNYIKVVRSSSDARNIKVYKNNNMIINYGSSTTKKPFHDNEWVNVCLSYDGKDITIAEYDNKQTTSIGTNSYTLSDFSTENAKIIIGGDIDGRSGEYSPMQLTEFCVFDKVLGSGDLTTVNTNTNIKKYTTMSDIGNLVAYYDFGDTSNGAHEQLANLVESSKSLTFIEQAKDGEFSKKELTDDTPIDPVFDKDGALNLTQTAKKGGILLNVVPTDKNNFTISFFIKNESGDTPNHEAELVYMGPLSTESEYYNIYRSQNKSTSSSGDPKHIRFSENSQYGNKASGSNVFNQGGDWKKVTFTVQNGVAKAYVDGLAVETAGGSSNKNTFGLLDEDDFNIILGGLKDEYDGKDILIKDFAIYDSVLTDKQVEEISSSENNHIAVTEDGSVIGKYPDVMESLTPEQRAGWYFVNSGSNLKNFYDNIGTAKEFCGLVPDEVIANKIDLSKLPQSVQDYFGDDEKKALVEEGNGGFIATSGKDFTGKGYLWDGKDSATNVTVESSEEATYKVAIEVPSEGSRQVDGNSPCVFFIDSAGYLRCFYNNGGNTHTKDSKGNDNYTDELRSGVSYVYQKDDDTTIKTEDLSYALGQFAAKLHNATPNSMVSAVRFSNQNVAEGYAKGKPDEDGYDKNVLKKLVMLDWTSDTKEISELLSLTRGDGGMTSTGSETSDPTGKDLAKDAVALEQYNYGMTGGTYTWTGFKAYTEFLNKQIAEGDEAKKYIILFTDGMDNMLDETEDERNYAITLANELKKEYTIFCVVLRNKTFDTGAESGKETRGERVRKYMAEIAGNSATKGETYETLADKYIFEANDVNSLTSAFTGEILSQISSSLIDYTVQDYIDPRFDLVDRTGDTIVLGKDGKVTIKGEDGKVKEETLSTDYPKGYSNPNAKGVIYNIDGEKAILCYNTDKDRYYLEWSALPTQDNICPCR